MSRIGKKVIAIPEKTEISMSGTVLTVKGPKATLTRDFKKDIGIKIEAGTLTLVPLKKEEDMDNTALWGTYASHVINMIKGVTEGFTKKLIIEGIGYKSEVKGAELVLALGFSHQVKVAIPAELKVTAEKNIITVTGSDKEQVGEFVASVRALKKPEPYKGKGIRYDDEVIQRKQGKKST